MYIERDTLINNKTYSKLLAFGDFAYTPVSFLRDSLHCIVNEKGRVLFSSEDFSNILSTYYATGAPSDTICRIEVKMQDKDKIFSVSAGNFKTSTAKSTYYFYPNWQMRGDIRYTYNRYSENVGLVSKIFFSAFIIQTIMKEDWCGIK